MSESNLGSKQDKLNSE